MGVNNKIPLSSLFLALVLSGCGSSDDSEDEDSKHSISGNIQGLNGEIQLILNKAGQSWTSGNYIGNGVADVSFTIDSFESGTVYSVEVREQPEGQNCTVANGSGTVSSDVSDIVVTCVDLPKEQLGVFIDSPVQGLSYFTDTFSGETLEDGSFKYMQDETVTFVMGSTQFSVAQLAEGVILSPLDVFSAQDTSDRRVINLASLLQSLDIDRVADNGIELRSGEIANNGLVINFDVPTDEFANNNDILAFVQSANPDFETSPLVDADEAKEHLDNQLALASKCDLDRAFNLTSHETVIPSDIGVAGNNTGMTGTTFTVSKTGLCSLNSGEGWSGDCSINGSKVNITIDGDSQVLTGTLANNNVTLVAMPGLYDAGDGTKEYVSVYFDGNSNVSCPIEDVSAGVYSYTGKEAVSQLDGSGEEVYGVTGTITLNDDSCEIQSSEGDFSCQVTGNRIFGLGEASGVKGTITPEQVTMYFNSPGVDGELVVGYFNGTRQAN